MGKHSSLNHLPQSLRQLGHARFTHGSTHGQLFQLVTLIADKHTVAAKEGHCGKKCIALVAIVKDMPAAMATQYAAASFAFWYASKSSLLITTATEPSRRVSPPARHSWLHPVRRRYWRVPGLMYR